MYLPGTVKDRIGDLRTNKGLSQKELSEIIGVAPSQMSRIESGETQKVSIDILIKLAKVFEVSTDYLLGLTPLSVPMNYDISRLGLSEESVKRLITGEIDTQILSPLLEHSKFPYLIIMIKNYFYEESVAGITARNDVIDMATAMIGDFVKKNPKYKDEIYKDIKEIKSHKMGKHEAVQEKIKSILLSILRDIKKDIDVPEPPKPAPIATAEFMKEMYKQLQKKQKGKKPPTKEDFIDVFTNVTKQTGIINDSNTELFKQLAGSMLDESVVKKDDRKKK